MSADSRCFFACFCFAPSDESLRCPCSAFTGITASCDSCISQSCGPAISACTSPSCATCFAGPYSSSGLAPSCAQEINACTLVGCVAGSCGALCPALVPSFRCAAIAAGTTTEINFIFKDMVRKSA